MLSFLQVFFLHVSIDRKHPLELMLCKENNPHLFWVGGWVWRYYCCAHCTAEGSWDLSKAPGNYWQRCEILLVLRLDVTRLRHFALLNAFYCPLKKKPHNFPLPNFVLKEYYIADTSEDQVFVCVTYSNNSTSLYISEAEGLHFSLTLENILYYSPGGSGSDTLVR